MSKPNLVNRIRKLVSYHTKKYPLVCLPVEQFGLSGNWRLISKRELPNGMVECVIRQAGFFWWLGFSEKITIPKNFVKFFYR